MVRAPISSFNHTPLLQIQPFVTAEVRHPSRPSLHIRRLRLESRVLTRLGGAQRQLFSAYYALPLSNNEEALGEFASSD